MCNETPRSACANAKSTDTLKYIREKKKMTIRCFTSFKQYLSHTEIMEG